MKSELGSRATGSNLGGRGEVVKRIGALRFTTRSLGAVDLGALLLAFRPALPELVSAAERAYEASVLVSVHGRDFEDATGLAVRRSLLFPEALKDGDGAAGPQVRDAASLLRTGPRRRARRFLP